MDLSQQPQPQVLTREEFSARISDIYPTLKEKKGIIIPYSFFYDIYDAADSRDLHILLEQLESDLDDLCESRLELECEHSELLISGFENSFFGGRQYANYDEMLEAHETYLNQINILNNQISGLKQQIDFFKIKVKFSPSYVLYNVKYLLNNSEKNLSIYADFL